MKLHGNELKFMEIKQKTVDQLARDVSDLFQGTKTSVEYPDYGIHPQSLHDYFTVFIRLRQKTAYHADGLHLQEPILPFYSFIKKVTHTT